MDPHPTTKNYRAGEISVHPEIPNFDRIARLYRWMEYLSFGPMLERCRFQFLPECTQARLALVLGDGDGRFTARLLRANPHLQIDAVDASAVMLTQLRQRASQAAADADRRLRIIHTDIRSFIPDCDGYDLVVSHFFLDCLSEKEISRLTKRLLPHLTQHALWVVSEFSIPPQGWRRKIAKSIVNFLYFVFNNMTHLKVRRLPDYSQILLHSGFSRRKHAGSLGGLLTAELWRKETDASNPGLS